MCRVERGRGTDRMIERGRESQGTTVCSESNRKLLLGEEREISTFVPKL